MSDPKQSAISIQLLSEAYIDQSLELCREAGWNQLRADWQRLMHHEPQGCFAAIRDGQLVGTVTTTRYGQTLGWIGMMLVHPNFRRQGIATALMQHGMAYLDGHQIPCIKLDATPVGQPVYEQLGFEIEWTFHRWRREGRTGRRLVDGPDRSDRTDRLSEALSNLDREAFGADRSALLNLLLEESLLDVRPDGFGMLRLGHLASYLGPVSARTPAVAESIVAALCQRTEQAVFWDIPAPNTAAIRLAQALGFAPVRELTRMRLGVEGLSPQLKWQYALAGPATG